MRIHSFLLNFAQKRNKIIQQWTLENLFERLKATIIRNDFLRTIIIIGLIALACLDTPGSTLYNSKYRKINMIMTDKKFRVLNLVLFSFILLFSLTKYLFPVVIVPIGWIPFIENPYPVSVASILRNILLVFAIIINLYHLVRDKR